MDRAPRPAVLAVVVAREGKRWLAEAVAALRAQTYERLEVVAVDATPDGTAAEVFHAHLGDARVVEVGEDLGFAQAVEAGLGHVMAAEDLDLDAVDHLLFVHDDVALAEDAVARLAAALDADPRLGIVGPKHVDWHEPSRLLHVGRSVDATGRTGPSLEPDELDHGQRDHTGPVLYLSTAGMMVRRELFETLGGFDDRYHVARDDLDLCWRAWLAGADVEVVPAAVARHAAGVVDEQRADDGSEAYDHLVERNTLATLLKTYGALRLAVVLPLLAVTAVLKLVGLVVARRFRAAGRLVQAWAWNVRELPETWRRRRATQRRRQRTDAELRPLFLLLAPPGRAWLQGRRDRADRDHHRDPAQGRRALRRRPVLVAALALTAVLVLVAVPLLGAGSLRGGELLPWPDRAADFLAVYLSDWHEAAGLGTAQQPSPAQVVLAAHSLLALGNDWLAPRLLLIGSLVLAWALAVRAGRIVTARPAPRILGATLYVLSPPLLAAVTHGQVGALVAAWTLPALAVAWDTLLRPHAPPGRTWAATGGAAVAGAVLVSFVPAAAVLIAAATVAALGFLAAARDLPRRGEVALRVLAAAAATFALLLPWLVDRWGERPGLLAGTAPVDAAAQPLWSWLLLDVGTPLAPVAGAALLVGATVGLVVGVGRRPRLTVGLWGATLTGVVAAWALGRAGADAATWPGVPLLLAAGALAALVMLAMADAPEALSQHAFGWRQTAVVGALAVTGAGAAVAAVAVVAGDPWAAYAVGEPPLPSFVTAEDATVGDYRVLTLAEDDDGGVRWDLTGEHGPSMLTYGLRPDAGLLDAVGRSVEEILAGGDPGAASRLGLANVRWVVVPPGGAGEILDAALPSQVDLEPQPVADGSVHQVASWLPRVVHVPAATAVALQHRLELPEDAVLHPFRRDSPSSYRGPSSGAGAVLVAEGAGSGWEAHADGALAPEPGSLLLRFRVEAAADEVVVARRASVADRALLGVQAAALLAAVSLMLRPPRLARERELA